MSRVVGSRNDGSRKTAPQSRWGTITTGSLRNGAHDSADGIGPGSHGESIPGGIFAEPAMVEFSVLTIGDRDLPLSNIFHGISLAIPSNRD